MPRRVLVSISVLLAAVSTISSVHAIIVAEAPGTSYATCTITNLMAFSTVISTETTDCAAKAPYDWNSVVEPTPTQRQQFCSCKLLMRKLETTPVPHCALYRNGAFYSYKQIAEFAFALCNDSGSNTTTTTTATTTPMPTVTITTASPNTNPPSSTVDTPSPSSSQKSTSHAGLITGVTIAVIVVVVIRRRAAITRRRNTEALTSSPTPHLPTGGVPMAVAVEVREDHSPVPSPDDKIPPSMMPTYARMAPSPSAPDARYMA